jgi:branched-chain amino acid transport system permease protein
MVTTFGHVRTPLILAGVITVIAVVTAMIGDEQWRLTMTEMFIRMTAVVGIYVFVGNSGIVSFGHVGFMCIGAYAAGWLAAEPAWKEVMLTGLPEFLRTAQYPLAVSAGCGAVLAAMVALPLGLALMRLSGIAASIATFAFLVIVNSVYGNWDSVTGGSSSLVGLPTSVGPWTAVICAVGAIGLAFAFQQSRRGLMLRASREDEVAAKSAAIDVVRVRLIAFVFSAGVLGGAGGLYAHFLGILTVETFFLPLTFTTLAMLVVGGIGSLTGAVSGAIAVTAVVEMLRLLGNGVSFGAVVIAMPPYSQEIGLGVVVALALVFRPSGLTRGRELGDWQLPRSRPSVPDVTPGHTRSNNDLSPEGNVNAS